MKYNDDDNDDNIVRMTGGELFEYLATREKVDEATATMFLRQVLEGLCHLHQKNIVHLDLKVSRSVLRSSVTFTDGQIIQCLLASLSTLFVVFF